MKRDIRFRGKTENNQWVEGDLIRIYNFDTSQEAEWKYAIKPLGKEQTEVITESIGEFTGVLANDIRDIFEDDIVQIQGGENYNGMRELDKRCLVVFSGGSFYAQTKDGVCYDFGLIDEIEVLGNIHDNPTLLK